MKNTPSVFPYTGNFQTTIAESVECSGVGLHSGKLVTMLLHPAPEDTGVVFEIHTPQGTRTVKPNPRAVIATGLATTLGMDGARVATVEHLMAALRGLGVDNVLVEISGGEVPIMDGSAASFVLMIRNAGLRVLSAARRVMRIMRPVSYEQDGKCIKAEPYDGFMVDCTIEFAHPLIGTQRREIEVTPESFITVLAKARTFGFMREVEYLHKNGLALGGSLDNAVVLDEYAVLNPEGLRFDDEFVRHKILDFVGDMAMFGMPIEGRFTIRCSGHGLNNAFLRMLEENASLYLKEAVLPVSEERRLPVRLPSSPARRPMPVAVTA